MNKKVVVIGCGGLGNEIIKQHLKMKDLVIGFDLSEPKLMDEHLVTLSIDVTSSEKIHEVFSNNSDLLNNTDIIYYTVAAMQTEDSDEIDVFDSDYALKIYNINTLGALRIIKEIKKYLNHNAKICLISSKNGSMTETIRFMQYGMEQKFAYNLSKAALNMASVILHEKLKESGITVLVVHPGSMRTKMSNYQGKNDPSVSAKGIVEVVSECEKNQFYAYSGERIDW